ncbi:MAG: hypothetical protein R3A45_08800 [Bdellovibrionota bacterium]
MPGLIRVLSKFGNKFEIQKRISFLQKTQGKTIGEYLWESGRCAIAHSNVQPLVDPENSQDLQRINQDLPIIKELAEYFIEHELGIKSKHTVWKEHLYELDGFRKILGPKIVADLKGSKEVDPSDIPSIPLICLRIRDKGHFQSFENMTANVIGIADGKIILESTSSNQLLTVGLVLDLKDERLHFDGYNGILVQDNGSVEAAKTMLDHVEFFRAWVGNGELEIYDYMAQSLLSRCDPHLPVNLSFQGTYQHLDNLKEQIELQISLRENNK